MPKQHKLWYVIDRIEESRDVTTGLGKKYLVHLVDGTKPVWVLPKDLSPGVATSYDHGNVTPKKAKARVNRGYVRKQTKNKRVLFGKTGETDVLKMERRNSKWIAYVEQWVCKINKVRCCNVCGQQVVVLCTANFVCASSYRCCRFR